MNLPAVRRPKTVTLSSALKLHTVPVKLVIVRKPVLLAATLTHEIRNPLTNINLAVEMLKRFATDDSQKLYLDIILRASMKVNSLVNDLVRHEQDGGVIGGSNSFHQLLDEALAMAVDRITLKNISVTKLYAEDYEQPLNRPTIKIALTNIIINAIDAMQETNGQLRIVTKSINGHYAVEIEDNGCGINSKDLKNIFTPFYTNKPGGLGIGLAAAYDIFKANHIRVNVESRQARGTKFIFSFKKVTPLFE